MTTQFNLFIVFNNNNRSETVTSMKSKKKQHFHTCFCNVSFNKFSKKKKLCSITICATLLVLKRPTTGHTSSVRMRVVLFFYDFQILSEVYFLRMSFYTCSFLCVSSSLIYEIEEQIILF